MNKIMVIIQALKDLLEGDEADRQLKRKLNHYLKCWC